MMADPDWERGQHHRSLSGRSVIDCLVNILTGVILLAMLAFALWYP